VFRGVVSGILIAIAPASAMSQTPPANRGSQPAGAPAAAPAAAAPTLERTAGNLPRFPDEARQRGLGGVVTLELTIDAAGTVTNVHALRSIPALEAAAVAAVRDWHYAPVPPARGTAAATRKATVVFQFDAANSQVLEARRIAPQGPQPKKTKQMLAVYPPGQESKGTSGQVIFDIVVNAAGRVVDMQVKKATSGFESAARDAVRQWEYEPLMVGGKPVPFVATVTLIISRPR
jgi:TonB family protein